MRREPTAFASLRELDSCRISDYRKYKRDFVAMSKPVPDEETLTVDVRDFSVFRLGKSKRFELVKWFER